MKNARVKEQGRENVFLEKDRRGITSIKSQFLTVGGKKKVKK